MRDHDNDLRHLRNARALHRTRPVKDQGVLKLRLLRDTPTLPNAGDTAAPSRFGLQDNKDVLHEGVLREDGLYAFDVTVRIGAVQDESLPPVFLGPFVFGRPQERYLALGLESADDQPGYGKRIKARLADLDWTLVLAAQESGGVLEANLSGRKAGGGKVAVQWTLVDIPEPVDESELPEEGDVLEL